MMTTISGLLHEADGTLANGIACISWVAFTTHEVLIVGGQKLVPIADGQLSVDLYPTLSAFPRGMYYTVRMELESGAVYEEYWTVPDLPAVSIEQVRSMFPLEPGMLVNPNQIAGSGAEPGMILSWNGSYWEGSYVQVENVNPNWIRLEVGSVGNDFWIDGSPVTLGKAATIHIPSASPAARGLVTIGTQMFGGDKTFANNVLVQGRVGIKTATPQADLDCNGFFRVTELGSIPTSGIGVEIFYSAGAGRMDTYDRAAGVYGPLVINAVPLVMQTAVLSGLGIGINPPAYKLDVAGDCNIAAGQVYRIGGVPISASSVGGVPVTRQIIAGTGLTGGGDLSVDRTLTVVNNTTVQKVYSGVNGVLAGAPTARNWLNFIAGANVVLTAADNTADNRIDITINSSGGAGGAQTPWLSDIDANTKLLKNVGSIGVLTSTFPLTNFLAGRGYITVAGSMGVLELATSAADGDVTPIGQVAFTDALNSQADKRSAAITSFRSGATANNRGANLLFSTRPDGGAVVLERLRITSGGEVGLSVAAPAARLHVGADAFRQLYLSAGSDPVNKQMRLGYDTSNNTAVVEGHLNGVGVALLLNPTLGGGVGIGAAPGVWKLLVAGTLYVSSFIGKPADTGWEWWQGQFTHGTGEFQIIRRKTDGTAWFNNLTIRPDGSVGIGNQIGAAVPANALTVYEAQPDATGASLTQPSTIRRGLMVQATMASQDGAVIQMGSSGGVGWHIKQVCHTGNEGVLLFYGASTAANNLQLKMSIGMVGLTVYGNMNITGEYQVSGTNVKTYMQTPWVTNIDAANFGLKSLNYLSVRNADVGGAGWPVYISPQLNTALPVAQGSTQTCMALVTATPNTDQLQFYASREGAGGGWIDAAWVIRRVIDGSAVRGYISFGGNDVTLAGPDNTILLQLNTVNLIAKRRIIIQSTIPGVMHYAAGGIEIQSTDHPRIGFHWVGAVAAQIGMGSDAVIRTYDNPGTGYAPFRCANITASSFNGLAMQSDVAYPTASQVLRSGSNAVCYFSESYFQANANITNNCSAQTFNGLAIRDAGATAPLANQILRTQVNNYLYTYYINYTPGVEAPPVTNIFVDNSDGFLRRAAAGHVAGSLNTYGSPAGHHVHMSRYLSWGGYSPIAGYCVFDAGSSIMPNGVACNNTTPTYPWVATYPCLQAFANGATHGVRVDSCRRADSAASADSVTYAATAGTAGGLTGSPDVYLSNCHTPSFHIRGGTDYYFDLGGPNSELRLFVPGYESLGWGSHTDPAATRRGRLSFRPGNMRDARYVDTAAARAAGLATGDIFVNTLGYVICVI